MTRSQLSWWFGLLAAFSTNALAGLLDGYGSLISLTSGLMGKVSQVAGAGMLVASLVQYKQHRDNPSAVRLSKVAWMMLIGAMLVGLAFLRPSEDVGPMSVHSLQMHLDADAGAYNPVGG